LPTPDYYNILGVSRTASSEEIKKAYRGLAMRWHPDKNPEDKGAPHRFKDITAAYRCLSNPEERAKYDRLGPLYTPDGRPPRPEEVSAVAGTLWGNLFGRRRVERGEDLRYTISVSLEDVAHGVDKEIVVPRFDRCVTCEGDGADPAAGHQECEVCHGTGRSAGPRLLRSDCYHCDGKGWRVAKRCADCDGEGRRAIDETLRVKVPAGIETGQKLKLSGKGQAPKGSGPEGDLFVIVNVADHPLFRRRGEDVLVEVPLTYAEAALGTDLVVPTLQGTTTIRIPPGTPSGQVFRLAGRGLPRIGTTRHGDLHVQIELEVPPALDGAHREALGRWASDLPPAVHPRRAAFQQAVQERR